ncbi:MAG: ATP-binding protein [Pseudomonadota bacterium]
MRHGKFKETFRVLPNVVALSTLFERAMDGHATSSLACFSGPSGFGKTMASTSCVLEYGAEYVECEDQWTYKDMLTKTAGEMGLQTKGTKTELVDRIRDHLNFTRGALLLDDAHLMVKKGLPRFARHIADKTGVPVILIGEERLPWDLRDFPDVVGRIGTKFEQAAPASLLDVAELAGVWAPGLDVSDELKLGILELSNGSLRAVTDTLKDIARHAIAHRLQTAGPELLQTMELREPGVPPRIRHEKDLGRRLKPKTPEPPKVQQDEDRGRRRQKISRVS